MARFFKISVRVAILLTIAILSLRAGNIVFWTGESGAPIGVTKIVYLTPLFEGKRVIVEGMILGDEATREHIMVPFQFEEAEGTTVGANASSVRIYFASETDGGFQYPMPDECLGQLITIHGEIGRSRYRGRPFFSNVFTIRKGRFSGDDFSMCYNNTGGPPENFEDWEVYEPAADPPPE